MRQHVIIGKQQAPFAKNGIKKQSGEDMARLRRAFLVSGGRPPQLSRPRRAETLASVFCAGGTKIGVSGLDSLPPEKCLPSGC